VIHQKINQIFFVGLGGAGQRHLRIFKDLLPANVEFSAFRSTGQTPLLNSDFSIDNENSIDKKYNLKLFNSLQDGLDNNPDLIVISTPSSLHFEVAKMAAERNINIFVEKPFSHNLDGFSDFENLVLEKDLYFFVSFQRRFHPYLKRIKGIIKSGLLGEIITANFNVASYVPAWHQYEDYKQLYACRADLGGGVLLTEIHELDLCYWYFGLPDYVSCTGGNYSNIKLNVEDSSHVTLAYNNFSVQVNLCFMQQYNRRDLYIAGEDGYLEWNAIGNTFKFINYKKGNKEDLSDPDYENDEMFITQAKYFLNEFKRSDNKLYLKIAKGSLAIVESAKESMEKIAISKLQSYV